MTAPQRAPPSTNAYSDDGARGAMPESTACERLLSAIGQGWAVSRDDRPLSVALADAISDALEEGILPPGFRLPPQRELAALLTVSRSTVVSAFKALKQRGALHTRPGSGSWLAAAGSDVAQERRYGPRVPALATTLALPYALEDDSSMLDWTAARIPWHPQVKDALSLALQEFDGVLASSHHGYSPKGLPAVQEEIARHLSRKRLPTDHSQIVITAGAHQALALAVKWVMHNADGLLAVEDPSYPGLLGVVRYFDIPTIAVRVDHNGMRVEDLAARLDAGASVACVCVTPRYHSPTGTRLSASRAAMLGALSRERNVWIVENYALAGLPIESVPFCYTPSATTEPGTSVIAIGSFSKIWWGGLRIGWLRAPHRALEGILRLKTTEDLGASVLGQVIVHTLMSHVDQAVKDRRGYLDERANFIAQFFAESPEFEMMRPAGGLSCWLKLPTPVAKQLVQVGIRHGIRVSSGNVFSVSSEALDHIRIPLAHEFDVLELGITRLKSAWEEARRYPVA